MSQKFIEGADMSSKDVVEKMVDEVWNMHSLENVNKYFDEEVKFHTPHRSESGLEKLQSHIKEIVGAFPDIKYTIEDIFFSDNKVCVRWVGKGTHKGQYLENKPTNKKINYEGIIIYKVEQEKIKEFWVNADLYGLLKQMGVLHSNAS